MLTKADQARVANEKAGIQDRIETEVLASYGTDGKIDFKQLNSNLKARISGITHDGKSLDDNPITGLPATVVVDGYEIEIKGDTKEIAEETFKPEDLTFDPDAEQPNAKYYGNEVTAKPESGAQLAGGTWRLFYQDNDYTYIIHDELISQSSLSSLYGTKYDNRTVGSIGQILNPMLKKTEDQAREFFDLTSNKNANLKGVAYLTDPDNWKEYSNGIDGALFAIGGPTIELFRASFNGAKKASATGMENATEISKFTIGNNGYSSSSISLESEWCNGIYRKGDSGYWWLASPNASVRLLLVVCKRFRPAVYSSPRSPSIFRFALWFVSKHLYSKNYINFRKINYYVNLHAD